MGDNTNQNEQVGKIISKYRQKVNDEIAKINPDLTVDLNVQSQSGQDTAQISAWPDSWGDIK
ncbi:MAG TPA: hypothetical protein VGB46_04050 [Flavisolibacter sp.]|jgi:hypothetical protein